MCKFCKTILAVLSLGILGFIGLSILAEIQAPAFSPRNYKGDDEEPLDFYDF